MVGAITLALAGYLLVAGPACVPHEDLKKALLDRYNEQPRGLGTANTGALIELFKSENGETWTILLVRPDGIACMVLVGENWRERQIVPPGI